MGEREAKRAGGWRRGDIAAAHGRSRCDAGGAVRWRWQAVGGVAASASHRRVDGNNGSKGLGEGRRHAGGRGAAVRVRACVQQVVFFPRGFAGFRSEDDRRRGRAGRNLEDERMGGRGTG